MVTNFFRTECPEGVNINVFASSTCASRMRERASAYRGEHT